MVRRNKVKGKPLDAGQGPPGDDHLLCNRKSLTFFDTKPAVFHFHFKMCAASQLAGAEDIEWEAAEAFATQKMIQCLQSDELSMSAQHMHDQCHHAWRV
jgi:hypothetical protein